MPDTYLYNKLLATGHFEDPNQRMDYMSPRKVSRIPAGQELLVIRDQGLGDVLMAVLAVRALAKQHPNLRVSYAVLPVYVPLFRDCDFLHRVYGIGDLQGHFRHVLDLRGYSERAPNQYVRNRVDLFADHLGAPIEDYDYPLRIRSSEIKAIEKRFFAENERRPRVGVVVRASLPMRSWPMSHVIDFCQMCVAEGWSPVLIDHERQPIEIDGAIDLCGRTSVLDTAIVLASCDLVVSPDTGPCHLAEAVDTRTIAIFSTIAPELRLAHYQHTDVIWRGDERTVDDKPVLPCCPCAYKGCADRPCMTGVAPAYVFEKARAILSNSMVVI